MSSQVEAGIRFQGLVPRVGGRLGEGKGQAGMRCAEFAFSTARQPDRHTNKTDRQDRQARQAGKTDR